MTFYYDCSEKAAAEKAAIKRSTAGAKVRALLLKKPAPFSVDIHKGPFNKEELTSWARDITSVQDFEIKDELESIYLEKWRDAAMPLMVEECKVALAGGCSMEEIKIVLSTPVYETIKYDVLKELKGLDKKLIVVLPRLNMPESAFPPQEG